MAYQTALTIESVIKDIDAKKYLLPSIQREFVWSTKQIEKLFDSLMMDYPINAFLFWKVPKEKAKEFSFYEFLRDYHQRTGRHNPKANIRKTFLILMIFKRKMLLVSENTFAHVCLVLLSEGRYETPIMCEILNSVYVGVVSNV